MTTQGAETLADLVSERAGGPGKLTYIQLAERSTDPETGYSPSSSLLHRISRRETVKLNPPLIRAIAVGLGLSRERVAVAAARQFLGLEVTERGVGMIAHAAGVEDTPLADEWIAKQAREQ